MNNEAEAARREATQKHLDSIRTNLMPGMEGAAILDFHAGFDAGLEYANNQPQPDAVAEAVEAAHLAMAGTQATCIISNKHLRVLIDHAGGGPIDVILFCPRCYAQHVDKAEPNICEDCGHGAYSHSGEEFSTICRGRNGLHACDCTFYRGWQNRPHKSHRCHNCNHVWRAANVPTNGVAEINPPKSKEEA